LGSILDITSLVNGKTSKRKKELNWGFLKYSLLIVIFIGAILSFQFLFFLDPLVIITRSFTLSLFPIFYYFLEGALGNLALAPVIGSAIFDLYSIIKGPIIPAQTAIFYQSTLVLLIFIVILLLELVSRRFWCRNLCPLGAMLGVIGKFSFFRRWVSEECLDCIICTRECKMTAIKEDRTTNQSECILCLNCYFACPQEGIHYSFKKPLPKASPLDISRRRFITATAGGLTLIGLYRTSPLNIDASEKAIRPPGAVEEERFLDLCLRCQQCSGICATTGACLQPAVSQAGLEGFWTPVADMRKGYCEYNCNLCGKVCPSGAIQSLELEAKKKVIMGVALFDQSRCIPYYKGENCLVCQEHCPTPDKAIKFQDTLMEKKGAKRLVKLPYVEEALCIGCGICENKCPIVGKAGIFVVKSGDTHPPSTTPLQF
jgi:ferredoxin